MYFCIRLSVTHRLLAHCRTIETGEIAKVNKHIHIICYLLTQRGNTMKRPNIFYLKHLKKKLKLYFITEINCTKLLMNISYKELECLWKTAWFGNIRILGLTGSTVHILTFFNTKASDQLTVPFSTMSRWTMSAAYVFISLKVLLCYWPSAIRLCHLHMAQVFSVMLHYVQYILCDLLNRALCSWGAR